MPDLIRSRCAQAIVDKRGWLTQEDYDELWLLCTTLPGSMSSQLAYAMGAAKHGLAGGLIAVLALHGPGLLIMVVAGLIAARIGDSLGVYEIDVALSHHDLTGRWWKLLSRGLHHAISGAMNGAKCIACRSRRCLSLHSTVSHNTMMQTCLIVA